MNFLFKYRLRIHILHLPTKIDNANIKYNGGEKREISYINNSTYLDCFTGNTTFIFLDKVNVKIVRKHEYNSNIVYFIL
jgi:hypothetical protein